LSQGIYIHIPFCRNKCSYCHFLSFSFDPPTAERYTQSILREIDLVSSSKEAKEIDSIYFGGGTPSLIPAEDISEILKECERRFSISDNCEISLEANPGTISSENVSAYRKSGVNRISLGAQSLVDNELSAIGRTHRAEHIQESLKQLQSNGLSNLNVDLLLGLPNQTQWSWRHTLEALMKASIKHVSVYMLDLDEPCALSTLVAEGKLELPGEDLVAGLYLETIEFFLRNGYEQYEISNFALPGFECRHNLKYWMREPVYGLGLGSHSFDGRQRYSNCRRMGDYLRFLEAGESPVVWRSGVTPDQAMQETLFLGLRLTRGIDWEALKAAHPERKLSIYEASLRALSDKRLAEWKGPVVRLTPAGMLVSNEIFQMFV